MTRFKTIDKDLVKSLYIQGKTAKETAKLVHSTGITIGAFFRTLSLTKEDIAEMYRNLDKLHKEYDGLHSFRSHKERRLERQSKILIKRIRIKGGSIKRG